MENTFNPALFYRKAVRQICTQYSPPQDADPDIDFRGYLEHQYVMEKERFEELVTQGASEAELTAIRNGLFVLTVGLFTFGRFDVAEEILDHIPSSGAVRRLVLVLKAMLPMPANFDPITDPEPARDWLRANRTKLNWDEHMGKYLEVPDESLDA